MEEARLLAKKVFNINENYIFDDTLDIEVKEKSRIRAFFAIVLLGICFAMTLIPWENGHEFVSLKADCISLILGMIPVTMYYGYNKCGIQELSTLDRWDILSFLALSLNVGTIFKICLLNNTISFLWIKINPIYILLVGIILSAFNAKLLAVIDYLIMLIVSVNNLQIVNVLVGMTGVVYIICLVMGIGLFLSNEEFSTETKFGLKAFKNSILGRARSNINGAKIEAHKVNLAIKSYKETKEKGDY